MHPIKIDSISQYKRLGKQKKKVDLDVCSMGQHTYDGAGTGSIIPGQNGGGHGSRTEGLL